MIMGSSNVRLDPFKYGHEMAKSGNGFYFPYQNKERNIEYKLGYDSYLAKTSGTQKGKEQPLP